MLMLSEEELDWLAEREFLGGRSAKRGRMLERLDTSKLHLFFVETDVMAKLM